MALSVAYFRITHHLGRPHYVWDEYLYSVLEKVEVRVTVCVFVKCNCTVWDDDGRLILQPFRHFTYVTTHSPTLPSLYLCHSSFSNPSVASPTSQFILQPFFRFSYVTSSSVNSPDELPMLLKLLITINV